MQCPSPLPVTSGAATDDSKVEFYFSDSNIRFDKFLFGLVGYENRFVPLKLIASFKRMQRFPNYEAIVSALETSEILEFDESKEKIRRKTPLPPPGTVEAKEIKDKAQPRSIYAVGIPEAVGESCANTHAEGLRRRDPHPPVRH